MASIFTNLAFMHGHITDVALARRLAGLPDVPVKPVKPPAPSREEKLVEPGKTDGKATGKGTARPSTAPSHWMILGLR
jgi:hypothetical protein